jgi:glucose/arabinose dehydrogenase
MKTQLKAFIATACHSLCGAVLLIAPTSQAQNLFVTENYPYNDSIYEFTPGGVQSTFASGLKTPWVTAFNSMGDLYVVDYTSGNIVRFTPSGTQSTFVSTGLSFNYGLAFNSAGDLFASDFGNIYEFTPDGVQSTIASGLDYPFALAFNRTGDLFETDFETGNI